MSRGQNVWGMAVAALLFVAPANAFAAPAATTKKQPKNYVPPYSASTKPVAGTRKTINIKEEYQRQRLRDLIQQIHQEEADIKVAQEKKEREQKDARDRAEEERKAEQGEQQAEEVAAGEGNTQEGLARADMLIEPAPEPNLVINFDKHYVSYERQVRQLVHNSERGRSTPHYEIVSEVPSNTLGGRRNERVMQEYERNLDSLVRRFSELGVQDSRITISSHPSDEVTAQKVSIYQN